MAPIEAILADIVSQNEAPAQKAGLELLMLHFKNLLGKPSEDKFRNVKKTNPKVASTLFALKGDIHGLLLASGYTVKDADYYTYLGNNFEALRKAWSAVEAAVEPAQVSLMNEEERRKHEITKK